MRGYPGWWSEKPSGAGCNRCAGLPSAHGVDKPCSEEGHAYSRYKYCFYISVMVITMMMSMIIITCGTFGLPVGGAHPLGSAHH